VAQQFGQGWVRIMALALLYVLLALGLNIVVGYAGLLDLGFVAFYAVGAYMYALLASPAPVPRTSSGSRRPSRTGCTRRSGW
jgi:branched-chain amino acid transport system permease protein